MEKVVIIRYGEIFLKGKNRDYFESLLIKNIKESLNNLNYHFARSQGRYFVEQFAEDDEDEIINRLQHVFGIYSISVAEKVQTRASEDFIEIKETLAKLAVKLDDENLIKAPTFRVTVKRADKRIPMASWEIAAHLGGVVLENSSFTVNLTKFDYEFMIDIRENGFSFVYSSNIMCAGGLPVGCSGKGMLLLSGGIDSPVAAYMMAKRGLKLCAIHFASPPYTSEKAKEKVVELRDLIKKYSTDIKLFVVPFTEIQMEIHRLCKTEFMITIMRRFMMRLATIIAKQNGCGALITGESLGQVASQTMDSMTCTGETTDLPIFRPLIGFDKEEIMTISKKIGTFETSILPYEDCCTIFLPKNPAIKPKAEIVRREESLLDIDGLIAKALEN
ncbi:MAG: tRNA uracil 4-sulfurtransferase ThiI, partial [Clostridia bacterium]